ncbi:pyridoxamine 5-phosphate oxidase, putative [Babesia ovis]|uniref:Pyridoxamine 5-phosphate oxidase, putative n=1 Tax=Babesia ovis TaxID=5869 RepID=A0A9W5WW01_BABOV|nr:pyridoxamine 5-phosphate oxidase, putative [Babesia ovis]
MDHNAWPFSRHAIKRHIPWQLELIDTGASSASESDTDPDDSPYDSFDGLKHPGSISTGSKRVKSNRAGDLRQESTHLTRSQDVTQDTLSTHPLRIPLRRYAVSKKDTLDYLFSNWLRLLVSRWPTESGEISELLAEGNSLIGIQSRWLGNYECALLFRRFAIQTLKCPSSFRHLLEFVLRWWFCGKYGVHLSQFPHYGNSAVLNNAIVGIMSPFRSRAQVILTLLDIHSSLGVLFEGVLIQHCSLHRVNTIDSKSCNSLLLKMLPMLRHGCLETGLEPLCTKVTRFLVQSGHEAMLLDNGVTRSSFSGGGDTITVDHGGHVNSRNTNEHDVITRNTNEHEVNAVDNCKRDSVTLDDSCDILVDTPTSDDLLDNLWNSILCCNKDYILSRSNQVQDAHCGCASIILGTLVDLMSCAVERETLGEPTGSSHSLQHTSEIFSHFFSITAKRLIGFFAKWIESKCCLPLDSVDHRSGEPILCVTLASRILDNSLATTVIDHITSCMEFCDALDFQVPTCLTNFKKESAKTAATCDISEQAHVIAPSQSPFNDSADIDATHCIKEDQGSVSTTGLRPLGLTSHDSTLMSSFIRLYTKLHNSTDALFRAILDVLAGALLLIENRLIRDDVIIDEGYAQSIVASGLSLTQRGQYIAARLLSHHHWCIWSPDLQSCGAQFTVSQPVHCITTMHNFFCDAIGADTSIKFIPQLVMDDPCTGQLELRIPQHTAFHVLHHLCDTLESQTTCVGNIPVHTGTYSAATPYALVALAALMGASIKLAPIDPVSNSANIKICLNQAQPGIFTETLGSPHGDTGYDAILELLLRLLYAEISTDYTMALEYHSGDMVIYRTLVVHYLTKCILGPTRDTYKIFCATNEVRFDTFVRRLMRFVFFRVHATLMEPTHFESFMRTRVDYYHGNNPLEDGDIFDEINSGYIDLATEDDDLDQKQSDSPHIAAVDYGIFGFLEHSHNQTIDRRLFSTLVKPEQCDVYRDTGSPMQRATTQVTIHTPLNYCCTNNKGMHAERILFFESVFELYGHLRFCIDDHQLFQHNKVDRMLYQLLMHICHIDKSVSTQRNYEQNVIAKVEHLYETDTFGDIYPGTETITDPLLAADSDGHPSCHVNIDLLFLSRSKFTKRSYYIISRLAIEALVKWLSPESAACAVSRWAASVPLDTTSRVKSHKPETARSIVTMLTIGLLCHAALPPRDEMLSQVDSLVSAANVCFVNLKVSFDTVAFVENALDVDATDLSLPDMDNAAASDTNHHPRVKVELDEDGHCVQTLPPPLVKTERLSIAENLRQPLVDPASIPHHDSSLQPDVPRDPFWGRMRSYVPGELQMWKDQKLKQHRARRQRLAKLRNELKKNLLREGVHLLQTCVLFVHILGHLVLQGAERFRDLAGPCFDKSYTMESDTNNGILPGDTDKSSSLLLHSTDCTYAQPEDRSPRTTGAMHNDEGLDSVNPEAVFLNPGCDTNDQRMVPNPKDGHSVVESVINSCTTQDVDHCGTAVSIEISKEHTTVNDLNHETSNEHTTANDLLIEISKEHTPAKDMCLDAQHATGDSSSRLNDPKVRFEFNGMMQFVTLCCNTLESLFSACSAVSRSCVTGDLDVVVWDNDRLLATAEEELELLLHEISFLRDTVVDSVTPLQQWYHDAVDSGHFGGTFDDPLSGNIYPDSDDAHSFSDFEDDDLDSFIDFETDRHLGMVTSRHPPRRSAPRLNDVVLRSEWNCLIKSYLS